VEIGGEVLRVKENVCHCGNRVASEFTHFLARVHSYAIVKLSKYMPGDYDVQ
jgi:hypothetical protein